ncbi:MAG: hypothetical protein WCO60_11010 [Verrucomicrobiota bacterium]
MPKPASLKPPPSIAVHLFPPATALFVILFLSGCATPQESQHTHEERTTRLALTIHALCPKASKKETQLIARTATETSAALRQSYKISLNHNLHNLQVFWGLKQRGLCWHWQEDLESALTNTPQKQFEFKRVCANAGSTWFEHHALVVNAKGAPWKDGVVLDPWRQEGVLWFGPVTADHHPWQEETAEK